MKNAKIAPWKVRTIENGKAQEKLFFDHEKAYTYFNQSHIAAVLYRYNYVTGLNDLISVKGENKQ